VRKGRFGYQVIAITMKAVGTEMDHIFIRTVDTRIMVVGQPVVQCLLGRNAEYKEYQQYAGL